MATDKPSKAYKGIPPSPMPSSPSPRRCSLRAMRKFTSGFWVAMRLSLERTTSQRATKPPNANWGCESERRWNPSNLLVRIWVRRGDWSDSHIRYLRELGQEMTKRKTATKTPPKTPTKWREWRSVHPIARASLERIAEKADLKIAFLANDTLSDMNAALKYKSGRREKGNNKGHAQSKKSVNMNEPIKARVEQVISAEQRPLQPMTLYVAYNDDGQPVKQSDSEGMGELWNKNGYRVVAYRLDPNAS